MQTLIIYDNEGYIISQMSGDVREPQGVPFMWVEIPDGYIIRGVDTTDTDNHKAILIKTSDLKYENLTLEQSKELRIKELETSLQNYLEKNPIQSSCHNHDGGYYSTTKDKQQYLLGEISLAQMNGDSYQPSWNETGKACTYDWTLEELIQLATEIGLFVKPRVSKQQEVEELINLCKIKEDMLMIDVSEAIYEDL